MAKRQKVEQRIDIPSEVLKELTDDASLLDVLSKELKCVSCGQPFRLVIVNHDKVPIAGEKKE